MDVDYQGGIFYVAILQPGISLNGTDEIKMKNNFWGLGPRIGFDPKFNLGGGWSIYGDAAISGLYGIFSIKQEEIFLSTTRYDNHEHLDRFRWIGDFAAGIGWEKPLSDDCYAISLKLGWEYHIFWHQMELKTDSFDLVPDNRNLNVQGVTLSARFDF